MTPHEVYKEIIRLQRSKSDRQIATILKIPVDMIDKIVKHYSQQDKDNGR